jgi:cobalt-zinc-cadmium efflux system membrane fusion protein
VKALAAVLLGVLLSVGCGKKKEAEKEGAVGTETAEKAGDHGGHEGGAAEGGDVVRIEADMLRDLGITTSAVESRPGGEGTPVLGELRVNENAYAEVSAPVPARALRVLALPGARVRRGQALAEMQSLELGKTRGDYRDAQARVDLARQALERKRSLAAERIAPQREVQEAEAELRRAEASVQGARGTLNALGASNDSGGDDSRLVLRAPVSGTVIDRHLVQGEVAQPGETLFKVGDLSTLWLIAHASERDAVRVRPGSTARVAIPALPGSSLSGKVASVGSQVEVSSRTIPIRIELPNPGGILRPGMSASVWLPVGEGGTVLAVPVAAIQRLQDKWVVFVPREQGVFEIRTVGRGRDMGGEVEILSGLKAGETVVVEGAFLLRAEAEKARGEGEQHEH